MKYKEDFKEIREYVEYLNQHFKFNGLLHFTDFSNLGTILEQGYLYSRSYCENNDINFVDGANHSVLDKASKYVHNCVRFYYRGKTPTLYENEGIKLKEFCNEIHIPTPVYLLFDEEILYFENTEFTNGNATNSEIGDNASFFKDMDWDTIFHNTWFESEERDYIINKRQAELLSHDPVSLKYLKAIIFRCEADKKRAINLFGNDNRYKVDISLFSDKNAKEPKYEYEKNNFIKDYKIKFEYDSNGNKIAVVLKMRFQKQWEDYETASDILDKNGDVVEEYIASVSYENIWGKKVNQNIDYTEVKVLRLEGDILNWHKICIYVNDFICIEEFLVKHDIKDYNLDLIYEENKKKLVLNLKFENLNFLGYSHRYEIFNSDNELIYNGSMNFREGSTVVSWNLKFSDYDDSWFKMKYYIDNVLCISEEIE